jgi:hypothetical protein
LDVFAHLVGSVPDSEVAALAKMSVEGVRLYRKARGIASSFEGKVPSAVVPPAATKSVTVAVHSFADAPKVEAKVEAKVAAVVPAAVVAAAAVVPAAVMAPAAAVAPAALSSVSHRAFSVVAVHGDELRKFAVVGSSILAALEIAVGALNARHDGPWRVASIREGIEALTLSA